MILALSFNEVIMCQGRPTIWSSHHYNLSSNLRERNVKKLDFSFIPLQLLFFSLFTMNPLFTFFIFGKRTKTYTHRQTHAYTHKLSSTPQRSFLYPIPQSSREKMGFLGGRLFLVPLSILLCLFRTNDPPISVFLVVSVISYDAETTVCPR